MKKNLRMQTEDKIWLEKTEQSAAIEIVLRFSKRKTLCLKVEPNGQVYLMAPLRTKKEQLISFAVAKRRWIEKALLQGSKKMNLPESFELKNGGSFFILGEICSLTIKEDKKKRICLDEENRLLISFPSGNDTEGLEKFFWAWYRKKASECFLEETKKLHRNIAKYGIELPEVGCRKMKARWGTCHVQAKKIYLNSYLFCLNMDLIDYVVMHELCHFMSGYHDKRFYDFLSAQMPDWKERRKKLEGYRLA